MRYELFYLIGASREADTDNIKAEIKKMVAEAGGVFEEKETQEKRKLAYRVGHESHGIYVAQRFALDDPEKLKDLNGKLNLNNAVLRFIVSRADELPELKSKEERISDALQKESAGKARKEEKAKEPAPAKAEKETAAAKPAPVEQPAAEKEAKEAAPEETPEEKKEEQKKRDEEIDKKLEEILNI